MWRKTPQTLLIIDILSNLGHATNQEIVKAAHKVMPGLSATTVHRITSRLVEAGIARYAPTVDGVRVVDMNLKEHDHFLCRGCGRIVDINLTDDILKVLQQQIPGELVRHSIVITGLCTQCNQ